MNKKQAFAYLNADFQVQAHRSHYFYEGELNCTYVGEMLIHQCNINDEDAFEWAFEWVGMQEAALAR